MSSAPLPSSADLAKYLEARGQLGKPWMWHLLRLVKIKEQRDSMAPEDYVATLADAHADLMRLGHDEGDAVRHRCASLPDGTLDSILPA